MDDDEMLIKSWLLGYNEWKDRTEDEKQAVVDCIMAQEGWRFLRQRLSFLRGSSVSDGDSKIITKDVWKGLIQQHGAPHLAACPDHVSAVDRPAMDDSGP